MNKEIFKSLSEGNKFFFLLFLVFVGMFISGIISAFGMMSVHTTAILDLSPTRLKVLQTVEEVFTFLTPAVLFANWFQSSPEQFLKVKEPLRVNQLLLIPVLMITLIPFVNLTGFLNAQLTLPASLSGMETAMKSMEDNANHIMDALLADHSTLGFISSILVLSLVAAVCEEFFFRGALQQVLMKVFRNPHTGIWVTAVIFSAIHFQFYDFIPRMLLGALLGYIFYWTGSIWASVLAHFVNNLFAVVIEFYYKGTPLYDKLDKIGTGDSLYLAIIGFAVGIVLIYFLYKARKTALE